MEKVKIMSRKKFLEYIPKTKDVVAIRISDTLPIKEVAEKRYLDVLRLSFYDEYILDEDIDRNTPWGTNRFTDDYVEQVNNFIEKYKDKQFIIHCEQGISRSSAVGYYILKKLNCTEELNDKKDSCLYFPNIEVYGKLIGKIYNRENAVDLRNELNNLD